MRNAFRTTFLILVLPFAGCGPSGSRADSVDTHEPTQTLTEPSEPPPVSLPAPLACFPAAEAAATFATSLLAERLGLVGVRQEASNDSVPPAAMAYHFRVTGSAPSTSVHSEELAFLQVQLNQQCEVLAMGMERTPALTEISSADPKPECDQHARDVAAALVVRLRPESRLMNLRLVGVLYSNPPIRQYEGDFASPKGMRLFLNMPETLEGVCHFGGFEFREEPPTAGRVSEGRF